MSKAFYQKINRILS